MGKVACKRHGPTVGPLSCDHIRAAVANSVRLGWADYRLDLGDGTPLQHKLCEECAAQFGLSPNELIPEAIGRDESKYPYRAPVCGACFREWREGVQNGAVPNA
jgi:hypothetical protein